MTEDIGETVRWAMQRRLEFIDFRLFWDGRFNRRDLAETITADQHERWFCRLKPSRT